MKYKVAPALPAGLEFDTESGIISGCPKVVSDRKTYTVTASNTGGTDSIELKITVHENALTAMLAVAENEQLAAATRPGSREKAAASGPPKKK
jgi:hypothetical protein